MNFLVWLEDGPLGSSIRDSLWTYPIVLTLHSIGLAMLVGTVLMVDLRILGFGTFSVAALRRYFAVLWAGFVLNALSGIGLFAAGATQFFFSPTFIVKMLIIVLAGITAALLGAAVFGPNAGWVATGGRAPQNARVAAIASLLLWLGAIVAGRLTAYLP